MKWLQELWKQRFFRFMTYFVLIGGVVFDVGHWLIYRGKFDFDGVVLMFGLYLVLVLPVSYFNRNTE